jgi:Mlc titration factor MtfA (ptsG expression regulator)
MLEWWRRRQRQKILAEPFPDEWREIMRRNVGYLRYLTPEERKLLEDLTQVFVREKSFEGCGGLELSDEIVVTIAANACILLIGLGHELYADVESILVYPSSVRPPARPRSPFDTSIRIEGEPPVLLGEAHLGGPVILVWDTVKRDSRHPDHGHNVVFHEFAHKLDMLDHEIDGTPPLESHKAYARWSQACGDVYFELQRRVELGLPSFLDPYAATSEGELFAVATEVFFERPRELFAEHPALYEVLAGFYRQDPARRRSAADASDAAGGDPDHPPSGGGPT